MLICKIIKYIFVIKLTRDIISVQVSPGLVHPQTCSLFFPCFPKCSRWHDPGSCLSDCFISCHHLFSLMTGVLRDREERAKLEHLSSNHYASDYLWQYDVFYGNSSFCCVTPSPEIPCMHAKSLQSWLTLCNLMEHSPPGSSVRGILQARILEWVALPSPRGSALGIPSVAANLCLSQCILLAPQLFHQLCNQISVLNCLFCILEMLHAFLVEQWTPVQC